MILNMITQGGGSGGGISFEPYLDGKNHYTFLIIEADDSTVQLFTASTSTIDWGDGTIENVSAGKHLHTYNAAGVFCASFTGLCPVWTNSSNIDYKYRGKLISAEVCGVGGTSALETAYGLYNAYIVNDSSYSNALCQNDNALVKCVLGEGITSVGTQAFSNCTSLTNISLPSTIQTIGEQAFETCRALVDITIPQAVTSIGRYAFRYCISLASVHVKPVVPPTAGTAIFPGGYSGTIYVPSASLSAYQSATNWSTYASKMVGE